MSEIIVIDASSFNDNGGWSFDTQFVVNMGTPYLLAHGLGKPVKNAKAEFTGKKRLYHIHVYTYNWVSPWRKDCAPGIFNLKFNDAQNDTIFGNSAKTWDFEYGGTIELKDGLNTLELCDLTGFAGRCGMVVLSVEKDIKLPKTPTEVTDFIIKHNGSYEEIETNYSLAVCGGGLSGMCAALAAARNGLKTVLIQDRHILGGNNSSEARVWLGGKTNFEPYPSIGNIINEFEQSTIGHFGSGNIALCYEDDVKEKIILAEENIDLLLNHIVLDVKMKDDIIDSITVWDLKNCKIKTISAKLFCDSTGDSVVGHLAGADYEITTNGHMGVTNMWYVEKTGTTEDFPSCPWSVNVGDAPFPGRKNAPDWFGTDRHLRLGGWYWEAGMEVDPIEDAEYARDMNFRAMYGAWNAIKNTDKDEYFDGYEIGFCGFIGGKRESRRLFGDIVLTKSEVKSGIKYEDGFIPSTWNFDVHYPNKLFYEAFKEGDAFISKDYHEPFNGPFFIPYRCLYSRNIKNMFMAGRNVSTSHDALGTVRVMRTCGMMGEVVGYASKMCIEKNILPREVYTENLDEFKEFLKNIPQIKLKKLVANE